MDALDNIRLTVVGALLMDLWEAERPYIEAAFYAQEPLPDFATTMQFSLVDNRAYRQEINDRLYHLGSVVFSVLLPDDETWLSAQFTFVPFSGIPMVMPA